MRVSKLLPLSVVLGTVLAVSAAAQTNPMPKLGENARSGILIKSKFSGEIVSSRTGVADSSRFEGEVFWFGVKERGKPQLWRWASVTKQVVAVLIMQEVGKGAIDLDAPVSRYLPRFGSPNANKISVRQLLRHQSGLPNPDDVQASSIAESAYYFPFYRGNRDPLTGYCAGKPKGEPGGNWAYNNCDYIVAGVLLEAVTGKSWQTLVKERIANPLGLKTLGAYPTKRKTRAGMIGTAKEPPHDFATYGAAGGLYGSAGDLLTFDLALLEGKLLPKAQRDEMWDGQADLGFIALGQWVFSAPLKGCDAPVKIVERRGAIGGVQVRNFILPEKAAAIVVFADNAKFEFGEIWQGSGFSYDLLSVVACR